MTNITNPATTASIPNPGKLPAFPVADGPPKRPPVTGGAITGDGTDDLGPGGDGGGISGVPVDNDDGSGGIGQDGNPFHHQD